MDENTCVAIIVCAVCFVLSVYFIADAIKNKR